MINEFGRWKSFVAVMALLFTCIGSANAWEVTIKSNKDMNAVARRNFVFGMDTRALDGADAYDKIYSAPPLNPNGDNVLKFIESDRKLVTDMRALEGSEKVWHLEAIVKDGDSYNLTWDTSSLNANEELEIYALSFGNEVNPFDGSPGLGSMKTNTTLTINSNVQLFIKYRKSPGSRFSQTITFNEGLQNVNWNNVAKGNADFDLFASTDSSLPITFSVPADNGVVTLSGTNNKTVTVIGAGFVNITASQSGNDTFAPSEAILPLAVSRGGWEILLNNGFDPTQSITLGMHNGATSNFDEGVDVKFFTPPSPPEGGVTEMGFIPETNLVIPGNLRFRKDVRQLTKQETFWYLVVEKSQSDQAYSIDWASQLSKLYAADELKLQRELSPGNWGHPTTFVANGAMDMKTTTSLLVNTVGRAKYRISYKYNNQINFNLDGQSVVLNDLSYGDADFSLKATSSSNLPVSFSVPANNGVIELSGTNNSVVKIVGLGTVNVTASQTGNSISGPADNVVRTIKVKKRSVPVTLQTTTVEYSGVPQGVGVATGVAGLTTVVTYDGGSTKPTLAGTYSVVATVNEANYEGTVNGTFVIAKKTLSCNSLAQTRFFHTNNASPLYSYTGFVGGQNTVSAGIVGEPTISGAPTLNSDAGVYTVQVTSISSLSARNYKFIVGTPATITVNKATPVIAWNNPADIVYGTALGNSQLNATCTDSLGEIPGSKIYSNPTGSVLNAGNGQDLTMLFTPTDSKNYTSPVPFSVKINVKKAPLIVKINSVKRPVKAANPPLTVTYSGFVNGDTEANLDVAPVLATSARSYTSTAGTYPLVFVTRPQDANYTITLVGGQFVINKDPAWQQPQGMLNSMIFHLKIKFEDGYVATPGSKLAIFKGDELRGTTEITSGPSGMWYQLTAVSNLATETGLTLKVYDAGADKVRIVGGTYSFNADSVLGAINEPIQLTAGVFTQEISLVGGWNWISFNVLPEDNKLGSVLKYNPKNNDVIKTAPSLGGSATYFNGAWYGLSEGLKPGVMYKLFVNDSNPAVLAVSGQTVDASASINLVKGWNWVGFTPQKAQLLTPALSSLQSKNGDVIKTAPAHGGSATYFNGKWYGLPGGLRPGAGYLCYCNEADVLTYPQESLTGGGVNVASEVRLQSAPAWENPTGMKNSMIVHSTVTYNEQPIVAMGSMLAAFVGDECRGVAFLKDSPNGKSFQLNVASNEASEPRLYFKVFDASSGKVYGVEQVVDFNADSSVGRIDDSLQLTATGGMLIKLKAGWNIIGVGGNYNAPINAAIDSEIWSWDSKNSKYFKILETEGPSWHVKGRLISGHGYWIFCQDPAGTDLELK